MLGNLFPSQKTNQGSRVANGSIWLSADGRREGIVSIP